MNNKYIHSPYNAPREAARILEQQIGSATPLMIIIIEPGIGYLLAAAKARYPHAIVVALHLHAELHNLCQWQADHTWHPQSDIPLERFLAACVDRLPSPRIAIVVPPYAHDISKAELKRYSRIISHTVQATRSDIATVGYFGKKWIANSMANFLFYRRSIRMRAIPQHTICVVGSGPTLNATVGILAQIKQQAVIFSLPSALPCLQAHDICADMVINTDGGFWATAHFQFQHYRRAAPRLAMPLTATRGLYRDRTAILILNQKFGTEQTLAPLLDPHAPTLSPHGTVAATAVEFALTLQPRQILLFGIDSAYIAGALHCKPHSFEHYYWRRSAITAPTDSELLTRTIKAPPASADAHLRISQAHALYRQELQSLIRQAPMAIRRVTTGTIADGTGNQALRAGAEHIPSIDGQQAERAVGARPINRNSLFTETPERFTPAQKQEVIKKLLRTYRERIITASHRSADREMQTLMCALAAQHFHTFWKTMDTAQWHTVQDACIAELHRLEQQYL